MNRSDTVPDAAGSHTLQQAMQLLEDIDEIRDVAQSPEAMLNALTGVMARVFTADAALLFVADPSGERLELRAVKDRGGYLGDLADEILTGLVQRSLASADVAIWTPRELTGLSTGHSDAAHVAMVPIVMGHEQRLGTLLLLRSHGGFTEEEVGLMRLAESQLDSALVQARRVEDLDLRNRELETIYRVDRVRDMDLDFDDMLDRVLDELRRTISADIAFIMLYDRVGRKLEMRAFSREDMTSGLAGRDTVEAAGQKAVELADLVLLEDLDGPIGSVLCTPLILRGEILGVFGLASQAARGFKDRDARLLNAIASQMDTAIFENLEQRRLRQVLGRSVDPRVMQRLLDARDVEFLEGERQVLTVLYSDLRGSTDLAASTDPGLVVGFINDYLNAMSETVLRHQGTLDKFIGDEVMALFGAPFPMEDHALHAVRAGLAMQKAHEPVMERWRKRDVRACPVGVGIATGELTVGEMGSQLRSDYTVIGHAANLGARICARAAPGQVLISSETWAMVRDRVEGRGVETVQLKGIGDVDVYEVTAAL